MADSRESIVRAVCEAKAREIRLEAERRCGGRMSPTEREAVDSVIADVVEQAIRANPDEGDEPMAARERIVDPENHRWRVGRRVGRTIYALVNDDERLPSDHDVLIGVMDTPALAVEAVRAHNLDRNIRDAR